MALPPPVSQADEAMERSLARAGKLSDDMLDLINAVSTEPDQHPATQISAVVQTVAALLMTYRIPPDVFMRRVIIMMNSVRDVPR